MCQVHEVHATKPGARSRLIKVSSFTGICDVGGSHSVKGNLNTCKCKLKL